MPRRTRTGTDRRGADTTLKLPIQQLERDRDGLDIKLSDLLAPHNPGYHNLTNIKRKIALNDAEDPRETLGNALAKCKVALDRWLECV
jgi:hypothetical protein